MNGHDLSEWFNSLETRLETAYLAESEPWKQSGFSGPLERWTACRKPIADCIDKSGTFLDIGCANGYLLESIVEWTRDRGLTTIPYGLDLSERLVGLAHKRLSKYGCSLFVGNALYWNPPLRFDYVHTEVVYVPDDLQRRYVERLLGLFLKENGKLLVTQYKSRKEPIDGPCIDETVRQWGMSIDATTSGNWEGKELTRVVTLSKKR